jgi:hypothetical protein
MGKKPPKKMPVKKQTIRKQSGALGEADIDRAAGGGALDGGHIKCGLLSYQQ